MIHFFRALELVTVQERKRTEAAEEVVTGLRAARESLVEAARFDARETTKPFALLGHELLCLERV